MRSEQEIKDQIERLLKLYHEKKRGVSDWLTTTYSVATLRWVLKELPELPAEIILRP
jgi:hypothetical protein